MPPHYSELFDLIRNVKAYFFQKNSVDITVIMGYSLIRDCLLTDRLLTEVQLRRDFLFPSS